MSSPHIVRKLKVFAVAMIAVCLVICAGTAIWAAMSKPESGLAVGLAIGVCLVMAASSVGTTWKASGNASDPGRGLQVGWVGLDYLVKIVVLLAGILLSPDQTLVGVVAIISVVAFGVTQVACLFPTKRDPRIG